MGERRLGRGLDFFLTSARVDDAATPPAEAAAQIQDLDVSTLVPNPEQPRRDFHEDEIAELAASIRSSGMLQPILARRVGDQTQIVAGERRWRAAQRAGLERVPVVVREVTDEQVAVFALVENLHRSDLNPVEKARAFRRIQEISACGTEEVARRVGLDRSTVANFVRLLELPNEVLAHVSRGTLSMGHARALLGVAGSDTQRELADEVIRRGLSVREVEALVQGVRGDLEAPATDADGRPKRRVPPKAAWVRECEEDLSACLRAAVSIRYGRKKSKITIECTSREEFERLVERLRADA